MASLGIKSASLFGGGICSLCIFFFTSPTASFIMPVSAALGGTSQNSGPVLFVSMDMH